MPLLLANRDSAYKEWMDGKLARGLITVVEEFI